MSNIFITLGVEINRFASDLISDESSNTISSFIDSNDFAINPTVTFGDISNFNIFVDLQPIEPTTTISTIEDIDVSFTIGGLPSTVSIGDINLDRFLTVTEINSTATFSNVIDFDLNILPQPIEPTTTISIIEDIDVSFAVGGLPSTVIFGGINLIRNLTVPEIVSVTALENPTVFISIGASSINPSATFGDAAINRPVHRSLIFKNDNITQLGSNDAVEVSSGVIFNPSIDKLSSNSTGVLDLRVDVDGSSFTLPLVNTDDSGQLVIRSELNNYLEVANAASLSVDTSNLAANTYVNEQLALKADVTDLDNYLQVANVDQITVDTSNLAQNTYVNTTFTTKTESIASNNAIKNLIDNKLDVANVSSVGLSGDYDDLTNKPDLSIFANTTYVDNEIAGIINSAPTTLDTLNELAAALGDDENFSTTVLSSLGTKASNTYVNTTFTTKTEAVAANNTLVSLIDDRLQVANASATFVTKTEAAAANNTLVSLIEERIQVANLASVATSGSYNDLFNLPNLGQYLQVANAAAVATSGSYNDLSNTPNNVSSFSNDAGYLTSVAFDDLTSTPTTLAGYGITDGATSNNDILVGLENASLTSNVALDTDTLFIDSVNSRVGIGTNSPTVSLTVDATSSTNFLNVGDGRANNPRIRFDDSDTDNNAEITLDNNALRIEADEDDTVFNSKIIFRVDGSDKAVIDSDGNLGIGTTTPSDKLEVNGSFSATSKSFVINHPSKPGHKLRHGSLEGPENGVYVRGKSTDKTITLPDYWKDLVHEDSITVQLTPIGSGTCFVKQYGVSEVKVGGTAKEYFYFIQGERKDVERFEVEYPE